MGNLSLQGLLRDDVRSLSSGVFKSRWDVLLEDTFWFKPMLLGSERNCSAMLYSRRSDLMVVIVFLSGLKIYRSVKIIATVY